MQDPVGGDAPVCEGNRGCWANLQKKGQDDGGDDGDGDAGGDDGGDGDGDGAEELVFFLTLDFR